MLEETIREVERKFYERAARHVTAGPALAKMVADKLSRSEPFRRAVRDGLSPELLKTEILDLVEEDRDVRQVILAAFRQYVEESP